MATIRFTPDELHRLDNDDVMEIGGGRLTECITSLLANLTVGRLFVALSNFASRTSAGFVVPKQSFQCFPNHPDRIRRPDISFIAAARMPADLTQAYVMVAPDIAIEVVSPGDFVYDLDEKLTDYRLAGVKLVWVLNPVARVLSIHRLDRTIVQLKDVDILRGESVLPDFAIPLSELLPPPASGSRA